MSSASDRACARGARWLRARRRTHFIPSAARDLLCEWPEPVEQVPRCARDEADFSRQAGIRIFRLDRVEQVETLEAKFESPRGFSVDGLIREGKAFQAADAGTLRLRYSPRIARWIAEREGKTLSDDGSLTLDHPLADTDWAVRHVLQYGPEVTVLEPDHVRQAVVQRLEAMAAG